MIESLDHRNKLAITSDQNLKNALITPKKTLNQYHKIHSEIQKFLKSNPSSDVFNETIEYLKK